MSDNRMSDKAYERAIRIIEAAVIAGVIAAFVAVAVMVWTNIIP